MNSINVDLCAYDGPNNVGGPYVWIQRFPPQLRELGFHIRVKLFTWRDPSDGVAQMALLQNGFEVKVAKFQDTHANVRWLLSEMKDRPPDVFVANHVVPAYYAAKYLKRSEIPTIGILRSDDPFYWGLAGRFVTGQTVDQISGVVCVSEFLRQRIAECQPGKIELRRISSGTVLPSKTAMPPGRILRIAYVGRLVEEQKRASDLTRALVRVTSELQDVEAVLFGDGTARADVERILKSGALHRVKLAGQFNSEELLKQLADFHVIVLLSDYEGLPIALMEGMACGCVPVCLRIRSGIPELVEDGVTGLLVNDRGDGFVNAIRRLREEPQLWERLSAAARAKIENGYTIQACAKRWAELIQLLHSRSGPKQPIKIPRRITLPPTHPGFAHQDPRPSAPPLPIRMYRRTRIAAGRWRRIMLGQPLPK